MRLLIAFPLALLLSSCAIFDKAIIAFGRDLPAICQGIDDADALFLGYAQVGRVSTKDAMAEQQALAQAHAGPCAKDAMGNYITPADRAGAIKAAASFGKIISDIVVKYK